MSVDSLRAVDEDIREMGSLKAVYARIAELDAAGELVAAVDFAARANRSFRDPGLECRLVNLRHRACIGLEGAAAASVWPPHAMDPCPGETGIPEISPEQLNAEALAGGIMHHGAVLVRGMFAAGNCENLRAGIDRALSAYDAWQAGAPVNQVMPYFRPFRQSSHFPREVPRRQWVRMGGGVLAAESPRLLYELIELVSVSGLKQVLGEYLGERPVISMSKSTLRRVEPDLPRAGWHQDGAFMNPDGTVRTVNMWLALSHCGREAPGIDILPRRLERILPTGTPGADFSWSVSQTLVDREAAGSPVVRPDFAPGDVLLFDDLNLHRTGIGGEFRHPRYAVETWFFAPSHFPAGYLPILV